MEPMIAATTFATIVSLMADFVSHRSSNQAKDFDSFMSWLAEQRHDELKVLLESNSRTAVSVKALLNESRATIIERLSSLDRTLATIASGISQYQDIAHAAYPSLDLSLQAVSILEQFYDSGATSILEVQSDELVLMIVDGPGNGQIEYTEPRFVQDDLTSLVQLGLLDLGFNDSGDRMFKFKRTAAAFIEQRRRV